MTEDDVRAAIAFAATSAQEDLPMAEVPRQAVTIKLDANLPERLVPELQALGNDVDTVPLEHLARRDDADVWRAAQSAGRFFITQDLDFADRRKYARGTHAGLLLVGIGQPGRDGRASGTRRQAVRN